jgi:hypothetical protein
MVKFVSVLVAVTLAACSGPAHREAQVQGDNRAVPFDAAAQEGRCAGLTKAVQRDVALVDNSALARAIAVTYLSSIYGKDQIQRNLPIRVRLEDGIWYAEGRLPVGRVGGVPYIEICQSNGRVLRYSHTK